MTYMDDIVVGKPTNPNCMLSKRYLLAIILASVLSAVPTICPPMYLLSSPPCA